MGQQSDGGAGWGAVEDIITPVHFVDPILTRENHVNADTRLMSGIKGFCHSLYAVKMDRCVWI